MKDEEVSGYVQIEDFEKCCEKFGIDPEEITTIYLQNMFESNVNTLNNTMFSFLSTSTAESRDKERFKLLERFKIISDKSMNPETKSMYEEVGLMLKELLILRGYLQQITDVGVMSVHHSTVLNEKLEDTKLNMTIKDFSKAVEKKILDATLKPKEDKQKQEQAEQEDDDKKQEEEEQGGEVTTSLKEQVKIGSEEKKEEPKISEEVRERIEKFKESKKTYKEMSHREKMEKVKSVIREADGKRLKYKQIISKSKIPPKPLKPVMAELLAREDLIKEEYDYVLNE